MKNYEKAFTVKTIDSSYYSGEELTHLGVHFFKS